MPSAFAKAFEKKASKVFDAAKQHKHREGKSFGIVDVPDGTFSAVVTFETGVPAKGKMEGVPFARANAAISTGPHEGKEPSKVFFCEGKPPATSDDEMPTAEQQLLALLAWLLPDIQIDDIGQVEDAIELINTRGPLCLIGIQTKKLDSGKTVQNVYFNKLVKPATFEGDDAQAEATNNAPASTDGPEYVPAKGDFVFVSGDDATEYEVKAVSQSRQTANLEDSDGTKKNGIAWADLQPA